MKTFKEICMMTQKEVKEYMHGYLKDNGYNPSVKKGSYMQREMFLYS